MRRLAPYVAKRLLMIPVSMLVIITLCFGLVSLIPGDPAMTISGGYATANELAEIRHELGLDKPLGERYLDYLGAVAHGDLGTSFFTQEPVLRSIGEYLPNTLELIGLALVVAVALGLALGGIGAYFQRRLPDRVSSVVITATQSVPDFVLGLVGIYVLFYLARLAPPPLGRLGIGDSQPPSVTHFLILDCIIAGDWSALASALRHAVLPVLTLGIIYSSYFAKTARATLGQAMSSAQVEFARACGLPEHQVIHYAFVVARTSILTYGAILFGVLLGGAAIIETIFSWQGAGQWALNAMLNVDVPVIQGFVLVVGLMTLLIYLALDIMIVLLDPRTTHG
jgi:ABC-type dipeptide/oligopeptide/nickel transport system permease component